MSEVRPKMTKAQCKPLEEAGLLRLEKRGRANYLIVEEKAWDWAVNNFGVKFSPSPSAAPVLQTLLDKLGNYFKTHQGSLAELLTASETAQESDKLTPKDTNVVNSKDLSTDDLIEKVRQAYYSIPDGEAGFRVRLYELRKQLVGFSKQQINQVLLTMQSRGEISLRRAEDLQELNTDDEGAAIDMGDGDKRYFVRMKQ